MTRRTVIQILTAVALAALAAAATATAARRPVVRPTVGTANIKPNAVTSAKIAPRAVTTTRIGLRAVGARQLANDAVGSAQLADGSVGSADIADGAITGADVADGAIGGADIADGAVTGVDVADGSITGADVADGSLGVADLAPNSVVTGGGRSFAWKGEVVSTSKLFELPGVATVLATCDIGFGKLEIRNEASSGQLRGHFTAIADTPATAYQTAGPQASLSVSSSGTAGRTRQTWVFSHDAAPKTVYTMTLNSIGQAGVCTMTVTVLEQQVIN